MATVSAAACAPPDRDFARQSDRNVLLITIDTLRADALSGAGGPARTPS